MPKNDKNLICIKLGDFEYCWNIATGQGEIHSKKICSIKDFPPQIVEEIIQQINERINESNV